MKKTAFTLFELVLVIIIIGVVYSLVLGKINPQKNIHVQKLENLKEAVSKNTSGNIEVIVYDKCSKVLLRGSSKKIDAKIFQDIKVYTVKNKTLEDKEFSPIMIKDRSYDVCLRFKVFENKSSSTFIIKKDDKFIVFFPYFKKAKIFKEEDKAIEAYTEEKIQKEYHDEI